MSASDSGMNWRPIVVHSAVDGRAVPAMLALCSECGSDTWNAYAIHGKHPHLQCTRCGVSFCNHEGPCEPGASRK